MFLCSPFCTNFLETKDEILQIHLAFFFLRGGTTTALSLPRAQLVQTWVTLIWFSGTTCRLGVPMWIGVKAITLFTRASLNFTTRSVCTFRYNRTFLLDVFICIIFHINAAQLAMSSCHVPSLVFSLYRTAAAFETWCLPFGLQHQVTHVSVEPSHVGKHLPACFVLFCFFLLMGFLLFVISDQQHFVFCFAAHINVLVSPICNTFQQWDLPHLDPPGRGG